MAIPLLLGGQLVSNLAGGWMASQAAKKAARQQADAANRAMDIQQGMYEDTKSNLSPYIGTGTDALGKYYDKVQGYQAPTLDYTQEDFAFNKFEDPGAKFQAEQAAKAMEASAIAKGATGGGFARALQTNQNNLANTAYTSAYDRWLKNSALRYGQASDKYNREYTADQAMLDRFKGITDQGLSASNILSGAGQFAGEGMAKSAIESGQANAGGTAGSANAWADAWTNALNSGGDILGYLRGQAGGSGTEPTSPTKINWGDFWGQTNNTNGVA